MDGFIANKSRLSDRILFALELALEQEDLETSDILVRALETAMTRKSGGGDFVERREYPQMIEELMGKFRALKKPQA